MWKQQLQLCVLFNWLFATGITRQKKKNLVWLNWSSTPLMPLMVLLLFNCMDSVHSKPNTLVMMKRVNSTKYCNNTEYKKLFQFLFFRRKKAVCLHAVKNLHVLLFVCVHTGPQSTYTGLWARLCTSQEKEWQKSLATSEKWKRTQWLQ